MAENSQSRGWVWVLVFLVPVLLIGLVLRLPSIDFYPLQDEIAVEIMGLIMGEKPSIHPVSANWPPFLYFIQLGCAKLLNVFGLLPSTEHILFELAKNGFSGNNPYLWMGRILSSVFGLFTIIIVFFLGKKFYGVKEGIWGAVFASLSPLLVLISGRNTNDSLVTFLVILSIFISVTGIKKNRDLLFILSSFIAGLAVGAKYTGGIVFITPIFSYLFYRKKKLLSTRTLVFVGLMVIALIIGIIISIPGLIVDPSPYLSWLFGKHAGDAAKGWVFFKGYARGWFYHPFVTFRWSLGEYPLLILAVGGAAIVFIKNRTARLTLLPFLVAWFVLVGFSKVLYARYWAPFITILCLTAGLSISVFKGRKIIVGSIVFGILALFPFYKSFGHAISLKKKDTRVEAKEWLRKNALLNSSIASLYPIWFYPDGTKGMLKSANSPNGKEWLKKILRSAPQGLVVYLWDTAYPDIDPRFYKIYSVSEPGSNELKADINALKAIGVKYYVWSSFRDGLCLEKKEQYKERVKFIENIEKICGKPIKVFSVGDIHYITSIAEQETWGTHSFWPKRPGPEIRIYIIP